MSSIISFLFFKKEKETSFSAAFEPYHPEVEQDRLQSACPSQVTVSLSFHTSFRISTKNQPKIKECDKNTNNQSLSKIFTVVHLS
ncbi:hypothetical protein T05_13650 [Trichinella murrelli]|uniref:Uncharacterized protein n=1 Tax=Trichinella murrelli TaxID=144512 RepID=A0A0V0UK05_9BILA|nr:hypothetical protein T05_13650 [Trichinella murrelli]